jgi:hypothetical protein
MQAAPRVHHLIASRPSVRSEHAVQKQLGRVERKVDRSKPRKLFFLQCINNARPWLPIARGDLHGMTVAMRIETGASDCASLKMSF